MSGESQQIGSSLLSIEASIIIAGLEGVALGWTLFHERGISQKVLCTITTGFLPKLGSDWSNIAVYGIYAVLAVIVVGFIIEGLAGILETAIRYRLWGEGEKYWDWYSGDANNAKAKEQAQRWIWKSDIAYKDFSRRRLRILVTRNTACCFFILTLGSISVVNPYVLALLTFITALFVYLWHDARKGLRNDITNAGRIEP